MSSLPCRINELNEFFLTDSGKSSSIWQVNTKKKKIKIIKTVKAGIDIKVDVKTTAGKRRITIFDTQFSGDKKGIIRLIKNFDCKVTSSTKNTINYR